MMGQVQLIIGNNYGLGMLEVYVVISIIYWLLALIIQEHLQLSVKFQKSLIKFRGHSSDFYFPYYY